MKIHFMTAVDGNHEDYRKITDALIEAGHELVTDHYLNRTLDEIHDESPEESEKYAKKTRSWMRRADVIVFETTRPDVSVGYELAQAMNYMKPVIVFYRKASNSVPHSLKGVQSEKMQIFAYDDNNLEELLESSIAYAHEAVDVRFNFFISPSISQYLDWISKEKRIPRSVYLRNLIEKDMESNPEYQ